MKKGKGLIYYVKNLKDQSLTNAKLKGFLDAFYFVLVFHFTIQLKI
jgi:hypothetical protein